MAAVRAGRIDQEVGQKPCMLGAMTKNALGGWRPADVAHADKQYTRHRFQIVNLLRRGTTLRYSTTPFHTLHGTRRRRIQPASSMFMSIRSPELEKSFVAGRRLQHLDHQRTRTNIRPAFVFRWLLVFALSAVSVHPWASVSDYVHLRFGITAIGDTIDEYSSTLAFDIASLDGSVGRVKLARYSDPFSRQILRLTVIDGTVVVPEESASPTFNLAFASCRLTPSGALISLDEKTPVLVTQITELGDCRSRVGPDGPVTMVATRGDPLILYLPFYSRIPLIEALPVRVTRNGEPWRTYYFGYKRGIVKIASDRPGLWPISRRESCRRQVSTVP